MEKEALTAAAALADIDAQTAAMRRRIGAEKWPPPALGLLLGALAASLAWRNDVLFVVVTVAYLASLLPLAGTPVRLGVVPRDARGRLAVVVVACVFVMGTPALAITGPWWTAILTGVGAAVFVPVFGRWRRAQERRDMLRPAVLTPTAVVRSADAFARPAGFVALAAVVMGGAVLGFRAGWIVAAASFLVYQTVIWLLFRRQRRPGVLPAGERTARVLAAAFATSAVLYGTPVLVAVGPGRDNWLVAACYAVLVAVTVALGGWWQQRRMAAGASPR